MKIITKEIAAKLDRNAKSAARNGGDGSEFPPLKLFTPWGACTWLISERDPEDPDLLFGLCDLGMGCPELGSVRLSEIMGVKGPFGLRVERDMYFTPGKSLANYAAESRERGSIVA